MKKMQKYLAILSVLVICLSSTPALATNLEKNSASKTYTVSEEDIIAQLQTMSDAELYQIGYTSQDIKQLRNFDYFKALSERASLDNETLALYGYTPEEIQTLRDYVASGGRAKKTISPNTLTLSMSFSGITAGKQATCKVVWTWKRVALAKCIDCFAVAWKTTNGATINYINSSSNQMVVNWTKINPNAIGKNTLTFNEKWQVKDNQSIYVKMGIGTNDYFAYTGTGTFKLGSTSGTFKEFYIDAAYGHYYILATPSISVNILTGSVDISFKGAGIKDTRHLKRVYNANFKVVQNYDD